MQQPKTRASYNTIVIQPGCMACHGIPNDLSDPAASNGAGRGIIHGCNFTWPDVSPTVNGFATDFILLGGSLTGLGNISEKYPE